MNAILTLPVTGSAGPSAVAFAVNGAAATPDALVATVMVVVLLLNRPDAPLPGAVKVTFTPDTGLLPALAVMVEAAPAVTVRPNRFEVMAPCDAEMLVEAVAAPVASPVALMDATDGVDEFHVAVLVRLAVEVSLKVPVAVNWSVLPEAMDESGAETAIDTSTIAFAARLENSTTQRGV